MFGRQQFHLTYLHNQQCPGPLKEEGILVYIFLITKILNLQPNILSVISESLIIENKQEHKEETMLK
jgi:hypothetical protein